MLYRLSYRLATKLCTYIETVSSFMTKLVKKRQVANESTLNNFKEPFSKFTFPATFKLVYDPQYIYEREAVYI